MRRSSPAGFDRASPSGLEMLARLPSGEMANQIRTYLKIV